MGNSLAGFNGQRPDPISGHYHLGSGYRAYSPALGRFTTPDSWSPFDAGGINPYAWCVGDPVNRADPSGHFSLGQGIGMALGFIAGIALSIVTEDAAMPVVLTLMATGGGDAAIGAGAEFAAETIDGQKTNWHQVGIGAGLSVVTALMGFGLGRLSKLRGISNRSFGGLMMEGDNSVRSTVRQSAATDQRAKDALEFIRNPGYFRHELDFGTGEITSSRINSETDSFFMNKYERDTWTFMENRRSPEEPFYMSDIVRYQYNAVSTMNNFRGCLPKMIVRNNVTNMITRGRTAGKSGDALFTAFFNETTNGKSTQRILNDFGLRAGAVERRVVDEYDDSGRTCHQLINFYIPCEIIQA